MFASVYGGASCAPAAGASHAPVASVSSPRRPTERPRAVLDSGPQVEYWVGQILVPNPACAQITFVLTLTSKEGGWSGTLSMSPGCGVQGMFEHPLEEVTRTGTSIRFVSPPPPARNIYDLTIDPDGQRATGRLVIGEVQPVFIRASRATEAEARNAAPRRPQTPVEPLPYERRDVTITTLGPGRDLVGVLTMPRREPVGEGKAAAVPAVVLLPDEDATDVDHTEGTHKSGAVLADLLTRRGIAVLRCAAPGTGFDTGSYLSSSMEDAGRDAAGMAAYLAGINGVDPTRVGIVGRGEGALVAARAAEKNNRIGFVVLMAPSAAPWRDVLVARERRQLEAQGEDPAYARARVERFERILALAASQKQDDLAKVLEEDYEIQKTQGRAMGFLNTFQQRDMIQVQIDYYLTPRILSRLNENAGEHLGSISAPVLLLAAERDMAVPPSLLGGAESALKSGGNSRVTSKTLPGLNHWFQPCVSGFADEHDSIETTVAPSVADVIVEWIQSSAGAK